MSPKPEYNSLAVLMGPPGAGKTTIGRKTASLNKKVLFVSVGEYMRKDMKLRPPFLNIRHEKIFENIFEQKFKTMNTKNLLIDCNPYPTLMWKGVKSKMKHFKKMYVFEITADIKTLRHRLDVRGRKDHASFSNQDRLNYYFTAVEPEIKKLKNKKIKLINESGQDLKKCITTILKIYE